jgi:quercetin dioxygenase-like cupin family protein
MANDNASGSPAVRRTLLSACAAEGLPGWETRLYLIEYPPGADTSGHHHPVPGVGFVLDGAILSAFGSESTVTVRAGESFVDVAKQIHTVAKNASETAPLRFLVAYTVKEGEPVTVLPAGRA